MPTRRQRRVSELIHRELSLLMMRQVRDPRLSGVTITGVEVTPDLQLARVYFSVLGEPEEEAEALAAFEHASGFFRSELAARVQLRFAPELVFRADKTSAYAQRIEQLLEQVKQSQGLDEDVVQPTEGDADAGREPA
jgi:ribosome-binding factor A